MLGMNLGKIEINHFVVIIWKGEISLVGEFREIELWLQNGKYEIWRCPCVCES